MSYVYKAVGENSNRSCKKIEAATEIEVQPRSQSAATIFSAEELRVESVMPGIYLTKNFIAWNEEILRTHGFTHIIIIDKHIQELYYPSPVFKLSKDTAYSNTDPFDASSFEYCPSTSSLSFGKEFEAIDLNFGEKSYLTTVLPNCYRAVKFIYKALQNAGTILVIDCNGGEQKCLTIVVAYLMYKHNISFSEGFKRLKEHYKKADLDRFYTSQLYEYEPILQVQRAQSRGHSCSREIHSAILKRKKTNDDFAYDTNEFLDSLNPLSLFNTNEFKTQHESQVHTDNNKHINNNQNEQQQKTKEQQLQPIFKKQMEFMNNNLMVCDDYAMEQ